MYPFLEILLDDSVVYSSAFDNDSYSPISEQGEFTIENCLGHDIKVNLLNKYISDSDSYIEDIRVNVYKYNYKTTCINNYADDIYEIHGNTGSKDTIPTPQIPIQEYEFKYEPIANSDYTMTLNSQHEISYISMYGIYSYAKEYVNDQTKILKMSIDMNNISDSDLSMFDVSVEDNFSYKSHTYYMALILTGKDKYGNDLTFYLLVNIENEEFQGVPTMMNGIFVLVDDSDSGLSYGNENHELVLQVYNVE
jgi:hypothetical protein